MDENYPALITAKEVRRRLYYKFFNTSKAPANRCPMTLVYHCNYPTLLEMPLKLYQRSSLREFGVEQLIEAAVKVPEALTMPFLEYFARKVEGEVFSRASTIRQYSELLSARISSIEEQVKIELENSR